MNTLKLYSFIFLSLILCTQQAHASHTEKHYIPHNKPLCLWPNVRTKDLVANLAIPDLFLIFNIVYKYNPENKAVVFSKRSLSDLLETFKENPIEFCLGNKMQLIVHLSKLISLRLQQETYALQSLDPSIDTSSSEKIKIFLVKLVNNILHQKIENLDRKPLKSNLVFQHIMELCNIDEEVIHMIHSATMSCTLDSPVIISAEIDDDNPDSIDLSMHEIPTEQEQKLRKFRSIFISKKAQKPVDYEDGYKFAYSLRTIIDELAQEIDPDYDRSLLDCVDQYHQLP